MIKIGKMNNMLVVKEVDFGFYLDGEELGEILLPKRYAPENCKINDIVIVFLYLDSDDRLITTTEIPKAQIGEFAFLEVVDVNRNGAFLDWGLSKDLFVPHREQIEEMQEGKKYVVFIYHDYDSDRICATSKLDDFMSKDEIELQPNDEVDLLIAQITELGYKAVVNGDFWGLIFHNNVFKNVKVGDQLKGYVKEVRDDRKIDLSFEKLGYDKIDDLTELVLNKLRLSSGTIPLNSKSKPEDIYHILGMSKKNFKLAISKLYKERKISLEESGIKLSINE